MKISVIEFLMFFGMQFILTLLSCFGIKAITNAHYLGAAIISTCNSTLVFWGVKKLVRTENSIAGWAGYTVGSVVGTNFGIWFSHLL